MRTSKSNNRRRLRHSRRLPRGFSMKGGANFHIELSICLQNVKDRHSQEIATEEVVSANQAAIIEKLNLFIQKLLPRVENFEHISNIVISYIGDRKFGIDFAVSDDISEYERRYTKESLEILLVQISLSNNFINLMIQDSHIVIDGKRYLIRYKLLLGYSEDEDACNAVVPINYDELIQDLIRGQNDQANGNNGNNGNNNGNNGNNYPINLPSLQQAFVLSESRNYEYNEIPLVRDIINMEDIPLTSVDMDDTIIFKYGPTFFLHSKTQIKESIDSHEHITFECLGQNTPMRDNVKEDLPFFKLWGSEATFLVELGELRTALDDKDYNIFELIQDRKLPFTTSYGTVIVDRETYLGYNQQNVNYMSDDHCQANTEKYTYKIHPLRMVHVGPMSGGKRRSMRLHRNHRKRRQTQKMRT